MNSAMYNYSYIHVMNSVNIGDCINNSVYSAIGSSGSGAGGGFSGGGGGGRWPEVAVADAKKGKKGPGLFLGTKQTRSLLSLFHIIRQFTNKLQFFMRDRVNKRNSITM